jgi:hypothetical protein
LGPEHLPLIRLRLAEHGRLLFVTLWRNLQNAPARIDPKILMGLLERLVAHDLPFDQVAREHIPTLNWLINQAMVICDTRGYALFSPLFTEFLANRLEAVTAQATMPGPSPARLPARLAMPDAPIYEELTKTEGALLRYFQMHPHEVVSPEDLLLAVWKRPDASARRVQEAIRRLRLQLEEASPPVGAIENERGQGYRFVPTNS